MDPSQQYPIQAELDAVVGHGRLPDFTDRDSLPRVESVVREAFRRYPVLPLCAYPNGMCACTMLLTFSFAITSRPTSPLPGRRVQGHVHSQGRDGPPQPLVRLLYIHPWPPRVLTSLLLPRAILHDPAHYPDPLQFKSDRFLTPSGRINNAIPNPKNATFGLGRRRCPGRHLGDAVVWLEIACILSCFEIRRAKDEEGREIVPSGETEGGITL
jgi:hypothetical protein